MPVESHLSSGPNLSQVRQFWESHPLSAVECPYEPGAREFFDWHDQVRANDNERFAMHLHEFDGHAGERVLDVGCGTGWLCKHFAQGGAKIIGIDLTWRGVELTRKRLGLEKVRGEIFQASAEELPFTSESFDFVASSGVLHHTPQTEQAIAEIWRVLRFGGRAMIALYYRNWLLSEQMWPLTRFVVRNLLGNVPGRQAFRNLCAVSDLIRVYDGNENPLGKAYSRRQVLEMFHAFVVERVEIHDFPRRFLPWGNRIPRVAHRWLDKNCGLMIYATLRKHKRAESG